MRFRCNGESFNGLSSGRLRLVTSLTPTLCFILMMAGSNLQTVGSSLAVLGVHGGKRPLMASIHNCLAFSGDRPNPW